MMTRILAAAACGMMGMSATAQTVEFRFVERTGQTNATPGDALLEMAVQARVTGGADLGGFNFNIVIAGEPDSSGTLQKAVISNGDHTYFTVPTDGASWTANASVGRGGIASSFTYLAGLSASFNGLINVSGGVFTNTPSQEIGLISGVASGNGLTSTPGIDADGDGIPDLAPSNGGVSQTGETCPLPASAEGPYFANGQFIDIYRFRYTVTEFTPRLLNFTLTSVGAQTFTHLIFSTGIWGTATTVTPAGNVTVTSLALGVNAQGACCDSVGGCTFGLQAACAAGSQWIFGQACTPNSCPQLGTCCGMTGACTTTLQSACLAASGMWAATGGCVPNTCPQLGNCCAPTGVCGISLQVGCGGVWMQGGVCVPNPCPQPGACCVGTGCTSVDQGTCTTAQHGQFHGVGTSCGTTGNPTTCCPANFDGVGGVRIADIFAFLNSWLAAEARSDFNGDGVLNSLDVFAFIQAWFAGC
jgi:hypothetical protein